MGCLWCDNNSPGGDLLEEAIWIAKNCTRGQSLLGAFSGGKDSIAVKRVMEIAGIPIEWHYHKTTIDPPEVVKFIRQYHPDVIIDRPPKGNFFKYAAKRKMLPSRHSRWCCTEYKEVRGPLNTVWVTGVRREESQNRSNRPAVGMQISSRRVHVNPLSNWDSEYLWDFIRDEKLPYPILYDEGFSRVGCIGCPLASRKNRELEFARWPRYADKWWRLVKACYEKKKWDRYDNLWSFFDGWMNGDF